MPASIHFHRAMEALACVPEKDPPWSDILTTTRDLIGADSGSLIMLSGAGDYLHVSHAGLAESTLREYQDHFHKSDVLAHAATAIEPGSWIDSNVAISRPTLQRSAFYNDYMRPNGQHQILALLLERNDERLTALSFQRSTVEDGAAMRLREGEVATYVRAFQAAMIQRRRSIAMRVDMLEDVFAAYDQAICLVTPRCTVSHLSDAAAALLDNAQGLCVKAGKLFHPNRSVMEQLARHIARVIDPAWQSKAAITQELGQAMALDISRASAHLRTIGEPLALIRLRRKRAPAAASPEELAKTFGITRAEARILAGLASGQSPAACAASGGVSENTVRSQIASLKQKMDCARTIDLVRLALAART